MLNLLHLLTYEQGKEATFAQLAVAPIFLAKVPVGLLSGYLVSTYLPESGHQNGRMLWFIVGLLALYVVQFLVFYGIALCFVAHLFICLDLDLVRY